MADRKWLCAVFLLSIFGVTTDIFCFPPTLPQLYDPALIQASDFAYTEALWTEFHVTETNFNIIKFSLKHWTSARGVGE